MESFDKLMAFNVIEDALAGADNPHGRGLATGLCGAFHMCGLISEKECEAFLKRIPAETVGSYAAEMPERIKLH